MRSAMADSTARMRVSGQVNGNGTNLMGVGYLPSKVGVGNYSVKFVPPFRAAPIVTASSGLATASIAIGTLTATDVQIVTVATTGQAAADVPFTFQAEGLAR